ncbi:MAG: hypothetical protein KBA61_14515 [Spirochaetes bacterium]|nr:hypothetical protein [Spirochaetota bacterium]
MAGKINQLPYLRQCQQGNLFKRIIPILLVVGLCITCSSIPPHQAEASVSPDDLTKNGWISDDIFQVVAAGYPVITPGNQKSMRSSAKANAVKNAQQKIEDLFTDVRLYYATGALQVESARIAVKKEFSNIISDGLVVREIFNDRNDCEITYRVTYRNLKNKVLLVSIKK